MMKKSYVLSVILSLGCMLLATDALQAGHRRGGGCCGSYGGGYGGCYGGGYGGCYGGGYGGCYGGGYGGCYGGRSYGGCYGGGYVSGGCYGGYSGGYSGGCYGGSSYGGSSYGGCYGGYVHGGSYGSYAPRSYSYGGTYPGSYVTQDGTTAFSTTTPSDSNTTYSFYAANGETNGVSDLPSNAARVRVVVPNAQAKVWIDGNQTTSTGAVRMYHTPALSNGGSYRVKASWTDNGREMTKERSVAVTPGQMAVVDFTQAQSGSEDITRPDAERTSTPKRAPAEER